MAYSHYLETGTDINGSWFSELPANDSHMLLSHGSGFVESPFVIKLKYYSNTG